MFSVQCSAGRKRAGAAGSLLSMRVRHWRTSRQCYPQVPTNWSMPIGWVWIGPNREKRFAQLCTSFHMPTQANTIPAHANTSPNMPAHSSTTLEPPSQKHKPLCERYLHRWNRSSFPFSGGRQVGLDEYRQGIEIKRLAHRHRLAETGQRFPQNNYVPVHKCSATRGVARVREFSQQ